jgi:hypothetical protein
MEAIRGKASRGPPKSTDCHTNAPKASASRKTSKDRLKLASNRPAKRPAHGQSDADVSFVAMDRPDITLWDIDVDKDAPDTVSPAAQSVEFPRKNLDELRSAPSMFLLAI